ncbi:MAG: hypothetical protein FD133_1316 [Erysipelotrichaceae bacterium]|nr:MAG: hypothetical protein FD179_1280 [Erysipelotrichaceae bacterium]TXT17612.1 MAG: hypothetical protein FD133_1316 [Erysipelotrichaceae bacterium]
MDKHKSLFNNQMSDAVIKKAENNAIKLSKKFGNDVHQEYHLAEEENAVLHPYFKVKNLVLSDHAWQVGSEKPLIVGNIRMGYGHYRISMAIASCANAMGYTPYWFDLPSFKPTTGAKIISHLNGLYSMGSRWSQKYPLFNRFYWEPLNYDGFKALSYNSSDQIMAELMVPIYRDLPKTIPFIATHVWPAQAAIHAGIQRVVNAIPDNWPMALHLSQGSIHTVQTLSSYFGYKTLKGMNGKKILNPMGDDDLIYTGHYIDHELVEHLSDDTAKRLSRLQSNKSKRILMTVGGAGAQSDFYATMIQNLLPSVKSNNATLYLNIGDHLHVWESLKKKVPDLEKIAVLHFNDWDETQGFAKQALNNDIFGIHVFYHQDIFAAVYSTNLLMRSSDVLVTKPSELAFYPIPKLFVKRVGGHEAWGAIHSSEIGDGTLECETPELANQMMDLLLNQPIHLEMMNELILNNHKNKVYHGAYRVVELAIK